MPTYPVITIIDGLPTFEKPLDEILAEVVKGGAIKILSPLECITDRQRKWYKGVCLPGLVKHDQNGETRYWWDNEVKKKCDGLALLKKEIMFLQDGTPVGRLTTKGVGKKKMSLFIEEILSKRVEFGWEVDAPDEDLRADKKKFTGV